MRIVSDKNDPICFPVERSRTVMFSLSGTSLLLAIECVRVCGFPRTWSHVVTNEVSVMHTRKRSGCDSVVVQPRRCNIWEGKTEIPSGHTCFRPIFTGKALACLSVFAGCRRVREMYLMYRISSGPLAWTLGRRLPTV